MRVSINGVPYEVPRAIEEKLLADLLAEGEREYLKVPKGWRITGEALSRLILGKIEEQVTRISGRDAGRAMRPPRNADKNLYLANIVAHGLLEGLKNVEFVVGTDQGTVNTFYPIFQSPGASGGQVDTDRDIRLREDNGAQIP